MEQCTYEPAGTHPVTRGQFCGYKINLNFNLCAMVDNSEANVYPFMIADEHLTCRVLVVICI